MRWCSNLAWWRWALLGTALGLCGPLAGMYKATLDGNHVPLSYLMSDYTTATVVLLSCVANGVLLITFGLVLRRSRQLTPNTAS